MFYAQLILTAVLPVVLLICNSAVWRLLGSAACRRGAACGARVSVDANVVMPRIRASSVALLYLVWPSLVSRAFEVFACVSVCGEGNGFLKLDLEERCFEGRHALFAWGLGLPMILLYVIGLPVGTLVMVRRVHRRAAEERREVEDGKSHRTWGMFYSAFRPGVWW